MKIIIMFFVLLFSSTSFAGYYDKEVENFCKEVWPYDFKNIEKCISRANENLGDENLILKTMDHSVVIMSCFLYKTKTEAEAEAKSALSNYNHKVIKSGLAEWQKYELLGKGLSMFKTCIDDWSGEVGEDYKESKSYKDFN